MLQVELYSGGLFIQQALGWNVYYGMLLIIAISVLYSTLGTASHLFAKQI